MGLRFCFDSLLECSRGGIRGGVTALILVWWLTPTAGFRTRRGREGGMFHSRVPVHRNQFKHYRSIAHQQVCLWMCDERGDSERRVRDACALVRSLSLVPMYVLSMFCSSRRPRKGFIRSFMWLFETISLVENGSDDLPNRESDTEFFTVDAPNR